MPATTGWFTDLRRTSHPSAETVARVATSVLVALFVALSHPAMSEEDGSLLQCESIVSLEKRLLMERWAKHGACDRPVRARFTDRFLGYTCTTGGETDRCHEFLPSLESVAFDTSQMFRCIDMALTEAPDGTVSVSRVREWAAAPKQCYWDPSLGILATEIDFDNGQVCVGASCIAIDRLTAVGKVRLRRLVVSAFRELGFEIDLMTQAKGTRAVSAARAQTRVGVDGIVSPNNREP
jgi:hypothetical protein